MTVNNGIKTNCRLEAQRIARFIRDTVKSAKAKGVVVGLSGGVDSALTAALSVNAIGRDRVFGVFMFENRNEDYADSEQLARQLGMKTFEFPIQPLLNAFRRTTPIEYDRISLGNVKARLRMTILYSIANKYNLLVAGTGDRSEDTLGYFTKYGDGGVDFLPIAHLYKSQVRELAQFLGVPQKIAYKPSSPNLWKGHKAGDELPADYDVLDPILYRLFTAKTPPSKLVRKGLAKPKILDRIVEMNRASEHKRLYPPMIGNW